MAKILAVEENSINQNLLFNCLQTAGIQVVDLGDYSVEIIQSLLKNIDDIDNGELMLSKSIFPSIPKLEEVFKYIELNYQEPISLKEVAQSVGYSGAYLSCLVRNLTGKTVNDWITERRLAQARDLLLKTNLSVYEIAISVGYQTPNHFFKQFRDYHHVSPKVWKQKHYNH